MGDDTSRPEHPNGSVTSAALEKYFTLWLTQLENYTREKFADDEKARGLALQNLEQRLQQLKDQVPTALDHQELETKVEAIGRLPTAADHQVLIGRITALEKTEAIGTGKETRGTTDQQRQQWILMAVFGGISLLIASCGGVVGLAGLIFAVIKATTGQ
jgi:uncharacterized protein YhaN